MILLEITPLVLLSWVVYRLEGLKERVEKVEVKLGILRKKDIGKEPVVKEIAEQLIRASNTPKTDNRIKY